ncbi:MAG TPA: hypothetical protein VGJ39_09355 [Vicinamibacterales bacterium]|jgi:hypothetical protein
MEEESDRSSCGVALEGRLGQAYNEEAFRYFLEIERKRAARLGRPCLLLLVGLKGQPRPNMNITPVLATKLFSSLWLCLRETDVIGWYREDRVAGAVLTQFADGPPQPEVIHERVTRALRESFRADRASHFQLHVYQLKPKVKS